MKNIISSKLPKKPHLRLEKRYWDVGCNHVAGIDEVGRCALAGPVVAASVVLPSNPDLIKKTLHDVRDSKCLTSEKRTRISKMILQTALFTSVGVISSNEIDINGIISATRMAMCQAVNSLKQKPDQLLIDAMDLHNDLSIPQNVMNFGDAISLSIASASIIAKVYRDNLMIKLAKQYPGYGFESHKGYGTQMHYDRLMNLNVTPIHRKSFRPMVSLL